MSKRKNPNPSSNPARKHAITDVSVSPIIDALCGAHPAEARLLAAISDPANLGLPVTILCQRAGVNPQSYYRLMQRPDFDMRRREALREALGDLEPALRALKQSAEDGSIENKNGPQDRKLLFQLAGFAERHRLEVSGSVDVSMSVSDADMLSMYLALGITVDRWIPGIRQAYEDGRLLPISQPPKTQD